MKYNTLNTWIIGASLVSSPSLLPAAVLATVTGGGTATNDATPGPFTGTVTHLGQTIANWSLTHNSYTGFDGANVDTSVTTSSGQTVGIDINGNNTDFDAWDFTFTVTPVVGAAYPITAIRVLGLNPDQNRDYGPQTNTPGQPTQDVLTFTGTGLNDGTLSDPLEGTIIGPTGRQHTNGNLTQTDGSTISATGGTAEWQSGDKNPGTNWTRGNTQWSIEFPTSSPGSSGPVSLQYQAEFNDSVANEGLAFQVLVPEPSSILLCGFSGVTILLCRRR